MTCITLHRTHSAAWAAFYENGDYPACDREYDDWREDWQTAHTFGRGPYGIECIECHTPGRPDEDGDIRPVGRVPSLAGVAA